MVRVSKKYSFSVLAFAAILFILIFSSSLKDLPLYALGPEAAQCAAETASKAGLWAFIAAILSSQISIALITIAYITGQAKIDIQASATAHADGVVGVKHDD